MGQSNPPRGWIAIHPPEHFRNGNNILDRQGVVPKHNPPLAERREPNGTHFEPQLASVRAWLVSQPEFHYLSPLVKSEIERPWT